MHMRIDQGWHHGLTGQIDAGGPADERNVIFSAYALELVPLDQEGRILDDAAIASDEARTLVKNRLRPGREREYRNDERCKRNQANRGALRSHSVTDDLTKGMMMIGQKH